MSTRKVKPQGARAHRGREQRILVELQTKHGYAFADTLSARERTLMVTDRSSGRLLIKPAYAIKLVVPADSSLGDQIAAERKERDPRTSKARKARDRSRARARVDRNPVSRSPRSQRASHG